MSPAGTTELPYTALARTGRRESSPGSGTSEFPSTGCFMSLNIATRPSWLISRHHAPVCSSLVRRRGVEPIVYWNLGSATALRLVSLPGTV